MRGTDKGIRLHFLYAERGAKKKKYKKEARESGWKGEKRGRAGAPASETFFLRQKDPTERSHPVTQKSKLGTQGKDRA